MAPTARDVHAYILMGYSEWLDGQGLVVPDKESGDTRTHDDLVNEYLAQL